MSCNQRRVSFQINREPIVGQGKPKVKSKDGSPKCKKHKVLKETIVDSEAEGTEVTAKLEARPWGMAWTGPLRVLARVGEGSEVSQALWSIAADLRGIRRAQEAITGSVAASRWVAKAHVDMSRQMLLDMALISYDLSALVEGQCYLHTQEMGLVEGKIEVPAESSEEDEDMTLKE